MKGCGGKLLGVFHSGRNHVNCRTQIVVPFGTVGMASPVPVITMIHGPGGQAVHGTAQVCLAFDLGPVYVV